MNKVKNIISVIVVIAVVGLLSYKVIVRVLTNHLLKTDAKYMKAVIIDEKNNYGNSPVSHEGAYSYRFTVDGKIYTNSSLDSRLKVGDSIEIEYVKSFPSLNRPVHLGE